MRFLSLVTALALPAAALSAQAANSTSSPWAAPDAVDPAAVPTPTIAFTPSAADESDYQKYFIFNRADTDFATAYADIAECDNYARGRPAGPAMNYDMISTMQNSAISQYGALAGGVGGIVGGMIVGAIVEAQMAADRRKLRRGIMRSCMGFKGYAAFGLPKSLWSEFNFEEGSKHTEEARRMNFLRMQAKVASGPRPTVGEIR